MGSLGEVKVKEMVLDSTDPLVIELNRLENNLREKEKELGAAYCEIKASKVTEVLKDKALVELNNELKKLESKIRNCEKHLEDKNLEIKKLTNAKKEALAAQFAAEATLRRVHADQKDEESVPIEAIIAPYESDIRKYKNEITSLQDDKKVLERLIKSKDAALVEAERVLHSAQERAINVDSLQNRNIELKRQIAICQDENKLLEKTNRKKIVEVEKLAQTIHELEESILAGGAIANVVRDYKRQVSEINEEKKTLERELARACKVSTNRTAITVAHEWKDEAEKSVPNKQWIKERKLLQGEIQRLTDKLLISEKAIKAEIQLKDKLKLRLEILEEGLKSTKEGEVFEKIHGSESSNASPRKESMSQPRASVAAIKTSILQHPNLASGAEITRKIVRANSLNKSFIAGETVRFRKNLWTSSKFFDDRGKENKEGKINSRGLVDAISPQKQENYEEVKADENVNDVKSQTNSNVEDGSEDQVSGFLYDRLQKEVIWARKLLEQKDGALNAKDDKMKLLQRKIDVLITNAKEEETKTIRREAAAREKAADSDNNKQKRKTNH